MLVRVISFFISLYSIDPIIFFIEYLIYNKWDKYYSVKKNVKKKLIKHLFHEKTIIQEFVYKFKCKAY